MWNDRFEHGSWFETVIRPDDVHVVQDGDDRSNHRQDGNLVDPAADAGDRKAGDSYHVSNVDSQLWHLRACPRANKGGGAIACQ